MDSSYKSAEESTSSNPDKNSEESEANALSSEVVNNRLEFKFSTTPNFEDIRCLTNEFVNERNWNKYHTPRNLLLAMIGEVGELSELFQWRGEVMEGLPDWSANEKEHLAEELSDVLIYLLRLSEKCHIDLPAVSLKKIEKNKKKYPVEKAWGSSKKYTEYERSDVERKETERDE